MYSVGSTYLNHIDNSITRKPKSKIVVDGVTYTGETHLKTYPKFSHSTSKMIGGFSAATCEFEIYNRDGSLSLNGKEVTVYRGLEINGTVTWISMGIFSADDENITNNKTAKTITFKGSDRASKFDVAYVAGDDISYPCTLLQFVSHLCARHGITLTDRSFPMATMTLSSAPNIAADVTERQLIACAAELGGCTAKISRSGTLYIRKPTATGRTVSKLKYSAVSREPTYGPINSIALGHASYDDDIVYPAVTPANLCEWRIEDNPFVESNREAIISTIAANIIGMSFTPFKVSDFIDDFIFDLNDQVTIEDKDGSTFTATILSLSTTSRIRSEIKADTQTGGTTNHKIAGRMKDAVKQVKFLVDHQNNRINSLVENAVSKTDLEQTANALTVRIDNLETPSEVKSTYVTIDSSGLTVTNGAFTLKDSSGNTLISLGTDASGNACVSGNIVASSVEAGAITGAAIAADAITAKHIAAGSITVDKLIVGDLTNYCRANAVTYKAYGFSTIKESALTSWPTGVDDSWLVPESYKNSYVLGDWVDFAYNKDGDNKFLAQGSFYNKRSSGTVYFCVQVMLDDGSIYRFNQGTSSADIYFSGSGVFSFNKTITVGTSYNGHRVIKIAPMLYFSTAPTATYWFAINNITFRRANGGDITAGRIQSADGATYFDLDTGEVALMCKNGGYSALFDSALLTYKWLDTSGGTSYFVGAIEGYVAQGTAANRRLSIYSPTAIELGIAENALSTTGTGLAITASQVTSFTKFVAKGNIRADNQTTTGGYIEMTTDSSYGGTLYFTRNKDNSGSANAKWGYLYVDENGHLYWYGSVGRYQITK